MSDPRLRCRRSMIASTSAGSIAKDLEPSTLNGGFEIFSGGSEC